MIKDIDQVDNTALLMLDIDMYHKNKSLYIFDYVITFIDRYIHTSYMRKDKLKHMFQGCMHVCVYVCTRYPLCILCIGTCATWSILYDTSRARQRNAGARGDKPQPLP